MKEPRVVMDDSRFWDLAIDSGISGIDALEVGYRLRSKQSLARHLELWDRASSAGVVVTGLGVNDSHGVQWGSWENNFATWIATSPGPGGGGPDEGDPDDGGPDDGGPDDGGPDDGGPDEGGAREADAIAAGRVFFGDPLRFRGRIELHAGGAPAGSIVGGEGPRTLEVRVQRPGPDRTVRLVSDTGVLREWTGVSDDWTGEHTLDPGAARFVRAEIRGPDDEPLAFTNPVYFDPDGRLRRGTAR